MPRRFRTARQFLARAARRRRGRHPSPASGLSTANSAEARFARDPVRALDELGAAALELGLVICEEFPPRRPPGEPA